MRNTTFHRIFGYALASLSALAAVIVLTGFLLPPGVPSELRIMFGIVLVLLAAYRGIITWTQQKQAGRKDEDVQSP